MERENKHLLVEVNAFQHLQCLVVVTKERMESQQTNEREVTKHLVQRLSTKLASHAVWIPTTGVHLQLLVDVGFIYQRMQHIEHTVHVPDLWVFSQHLNFYITL